MFNNYADIVRWFTPRDPTKGKQLTTHLRVYRYEGDFIIVHGNAKSTYWRLCVIRSDNTVEFVADVPKIKTLATTLSSSMPKFMRLTIQRVAKDRYSVIPLRYRTDSLDGRTSALEAWWQADAKTGAELFPGIKFDMTTGRCLNPIVYSKDAATYKAWVNALSQFKRSVKVRAKIGALDSLCDLVRYDPTTGHPQKPVWDSNEWLDKLHMAIRHNAVDNELLLGFAQTAYSMGSWWNRRKPTPQGLVDAMNDVCSANSRALRIKFGALRAE